MFLDQLKNGKREKGEENSRQSGSHRFGTNSLNELIEKYGQNWKASGRLH